MRRPVVPGATDRRCGRLGLFPHLPSRKTKTSRPLEPVPRISGCPWPIRGRAETVQVTNRYDTARATARDRIHPRLTSRTPWIDPAGELPITEGMLIRLMKQTLVRTGPKIRTPRPEAAGRG